MNTDQSKSSSKTRRILYWVFTGLICVESLYGAGWDLVRNDFVTNLLHRLGYPLYLLTILGIWKIGAFVALLIPKFPVLKEWAYAGLFFLFSGALVSHLTIGDPFPVWLSPLIGLSFTMTSWALRPSSRRVALKPGKQY